MSLYVYSPLGYCSVAITGISRKLAASTYGDKVIHKAAPLVRTGPIPVATPR